MPQIFPRGSNFIPLQILLVVGALSTMAMGAVFYFWTPKYTRVGYQPAQPIPFSHKIHAGQLQMDCRYCHSFVETAAHSNIPSAQVCMNCHSQVQKDNPKLAPLREAFETGKPVEWVQVHKTPDYVYFNHSVHINRGVSCVSCHGRVDQMEEVYHAESHAMKFCLDCHRAPENHLRPLDKVTDLGWTAPQKAGELAALLGKDAGAFGAKADKSISAKDAQQIVGEHFKNLRGVNPAVSNCAGCHR